MGEAKTGPKSPKITLLTFLLPPPTGSNPLGMTNDMPMDHFGRWEATGVGPSAANGVPFQAQIWAALG